MRKKMGTLLTTVVLLMAVIAGNALALTVTVTPVSPLGSTLNVAPLSQGEVDNLPNIMPDKISWLSFNFYNEGNASVNLYWQGDAVSFNRTSLTAALYPVFTPDGNFTISSGEIISLQVLGFVGAKFNGSIYVPATTGDSMILDSIGFYYEVDGELGSWPLEEFPVIDNPYVFVLGNPGGGTAPVPEPATMMLFATGLAGLAGATRRKKI